MRDQLTALYSTWIEKQGLTLASADEVLAGQALNPEQYAWIMAFTELWYANENTEADRMSMSEAWLALYDSAAQTADAGRTGSRRLCTESRCDLPADHAGACSEDDADDDDEDDNDEDTVCPHGMGDFCKLCYY